MQCPCYTDEELIDIVRLTDYEEAAGVHAQAEFGVSSATAR